MWICIFPFESSISISVRDRWPCKGYIAMFTLDLMLREILLDFTHVYLFCLLPFIFVYFLSHLYSVVISSAPIGQGYGLTETCAGGTFSDFDDTSVGRVGPPLPCSYIKVIIDQFNFNSIYL